MGERLFSGRFAACSFLAFPLGGRCPRRGRAQSAGSAKPPCLHAARPLEPPLRGTRTCKAAKNFRRAKSEWHSKFPPGHWALAMWKIGAGAVPLPRLAWPSRCSRCWAVGRGLLDAPRMRAGQCPAPTIKRDGFRIHVGAAHWAARLPWVRMPVGRGLPDAPFWSLTKRHRGRPQSLPLEVGNTEASERRAPTSFPQKQNAGRLFSEAVRRCLMDALISPARRKTG